MEQLQVDQRFSVGRHGYPYAPKPSSKFHPGMMPPYCPPSLFFDPSLGYDARYPPYKGMYPHGMPYWTSPMGYPQPSPLSFSPDYLGIPRKPILFPTSELNGSFGGKRKAGDVIVDPANPVKKVKNGRRVCMIEGCTKFAQGGTHKCISHGGGKRCSKENCSKSAYGTTKFCISHGGGKRCSFPGCTKSSQGSTNKCKAHGGGRRCKKEGCKKSAQGSSFCKAHGGGKRCIVVGCTKLARGKPYFSCCVTHGRQIMKGNSLLCQ